MRPLQYLLILMLMMGIVSAEPPTPKGIDGIIYQLDGVSEVPNGTNFSICNLNNSWCINGTTGDYAHSGRISAAIKGNDGDLLVVRAWTGLHNSSRTVVLNGSMHNVNLLLNASQYPQSEVSSPMAAEHSSHKTTIAYLHGILTVPFKTEAATARLKEVYFTPSPKFPEYIEIAGYIKGAKGGSLFTLHNLNNNKSAQGIIGTREPNMYYGAVEGKPGDKIVLEMANKRFELVPNSSAVELSITLKRNHSLPVVILGLSISILVATWLIKKRR